MTLKKVLPLFLIAMLVLVVLAASLVMAISGSVLLTRIPNNHLTMSSTVPVSELAPVMLACDGCSGGSGGPG